MPARGVGGDYYDFLDLGNRHVGVALADVAGKGIAAALIMSVVQASLRSLTEMRNGSLADLASKMNRLLHRSTGSNSYATFFYAQVDEDKRELRYVNAGHNPPMLFRGAGWSASHVPFVASTANVEELATGGTIIGMFAQAAYEEALIELRSGDVLMLFSDGVSEAHDPAEEEFGEERLKELLRKVAYLPVNDMAGAVMEELKNWMRDAPQHDDLTFVLMKVS
jgi:sigma-B regulation protein RsbU (phosphoserine phosphatase)